MSMFFHENSDEGFDVEWAKAQQPLPGPKWDGDPSTHTTYLKEREKYMKKGREDFKRYLDIQSGVFVESLQEQCDLTKDINE